MLMVVSDLFQTTKVLSGKGIYQSKIILSTFILPCNEVKDFATLLRYQNTKEYCMMRNSFYKKQSGFTLVELTIGLVILSLVTAGLLPLVRDYFFEKRVNFAAQQFINVTESVQRRAAHDAFIYSLWDENGGSAASGNTEISWSPTAPEEFTDLLDLYLVAKDNVSCGDNANGWNPLNNDGSLDGGIPLRMETTALFPCNNFRRMLPFYANATAIISSDVNDSLNTFRMYINFENVDFGSSNLEDNNFINVQTLRLALIDYVPNDINGATNVYFGTQGDDPDTMADDITLTDEECNQAFIDGNECDIIVEVDWSGFTNGLFKRVDKQNFFVDNVTFGTLAGGVQQCAKWTENIATGVFTSEIVDCGIQGGVGNDDVTLVAVDASTQGLKIVNRADVTQLCREFIRDNHASGAFNLTDTGRNTPCGFTEDGGVVQLLSDEADIGTVRAEDLVATSIYAEQAQLYSTSAGANVLRVISSTGTQTFSLSNSGDVITEGGITAAGRITAEDDLVVGNGAAVIMNNNGIVRFGSADATGNQLVFSKDDVTNTFIAEAPNGNLQLSSDDELILEATNGVSTANGTGLHAAISALTGENFDAVNGLSTDGLKALSEVVTYDFARYLDDTSSPIQIVGVEKVENELTQITKPDCLSFADDSNYASTDHNPYKGITLPDGESLARLVLTPIFFKTYNESFGDSQVYAQHAVHSSPFTWDVFLYLAGEGAFATGAKEDAAGASLAIVMCDYTGINFSRKDLN